MGEQTLHVLPLGISALGTLWQTQEATNLLRIRITLWTFQSSISQSSDQLMIVLSPKTRPQRQALQIRIRLMRPPVHRPLSVVQMKQENHIAIL